MPWRRNSRMEKKMGRRSTDDAHGAARGSGRQMSIEGIGRLIAGLPITYNGSKKRLFRWLAGHLASEIEGCSVAVDAFSGSGIVSAFLANFGLRVYSCDALMSAYCMTVTLGCNPGHLLSDEDLEEIASHRCLDGMLFEPEDGWVDADDGLSKLHPGAITRNEAVWLGAAKRKLDEIPIYPRMIGYAALRGLACIRPFGTPNGRSTFSHRIKQKDKYGTGGLGHYLNSSYEIEMDRWFRAYVEKFNAAASRLSRGRSGSVVAFRDDVIDLLSQIDLDEVDLIYLDPPYGGPGCRDYSEDYALHEDVLGAETLAVSDFFTADGHARNFDGMLDLVAGVPKLVLSYNNKAWSDVETISTMLQDRDYSVRVETTPFVHGKRTVSACQNPVIENLIIATSRR